MCVYIYIYMFIYVHTHTHTHTHIYIYIYTHTCIYIIYILVFLTWVVCLVAALWTSDCSSSHISYSFVLVSIFTHMFYIFFLSFFRERGYNETRLPSTHPSFLTCVVCLVAALKTSDESSPLHIFVCMRYLFFRGGGHGLIK